MKQFKQMVVKGERGQAIVLIALFMVIMLAMVGVAIDGGGLFWLWRNAQNAADSAALQAAFHRCTGASDTIGETWEEVGMAAANINGFDNNGTDNWVIVDDSDGTNLGTNYTHVQIRAQKPKYFIQLVYRGDLEVTADAIVFCTKAVDFSNMPGAIALGDCNCPYDPANPDYTGGGNDRIDFTGNDADFIGGLHSNCDIRMNPGGAGAYFEDGSPEATGEVGVGGGGLSGGSDEPENGVTEITSDPLALDINMYAPGGVIYESVAVKEPHNGDWRPNETIQGLHYVDGDVRLDGNNVEVGPLGLTVVATGQIEGPKPSNTQWFYYGYTGATNGGDYGIADEFSNGSWPHLIAFTLHDNRSDCQGGMPGSQSAWSINGNDGDEDWEIIGVIYAPMGWVNWSGSNVDGKGAIISWGLDYSGSSARWEFDPSMLPPRAPTMNNVQ